MSDIDYGAIGKNVQRLRCEKGLSQMELSELADLSPVYISLIECAKRKASLRTVVSIARALEVTVDELLIDSNEDDSAIYGQLIQMLKESSAEERRIIIENSKYLRELLRSAV